MSLSVLPDAITGFALVLTEAYERTARIAVLDRAIVMYEWLVDQPATRSAGRCQALGVCLVKRFGYAYGRFDLERALPLLAEVADGMTASADCARVLGLTPGDQVRRVDRLFAVDGALRLTAGGFPDCPALFAKWVTRTVQGRLERGVDRVRRGDPRPPARPHARSRVR
ncbi:hypothetical protein ABZS66_40355 [Dactylosporangium sp. NPDC005572]|uniref:hypothetical protein n=1 Tax=Dactylosporangium sp. NPDC005572 TaxID=3156889 RepID=UPI0033AE3A46